LSFHNCNGRCNYFMNITKLKENRNKQTFDKTSLCYPKDNK
jgi:hypothetical protein